jgi:hypothetical protein
MKNNLVVKYDVAVLEYTDGSCVVEVDHSKYFDNFLDAVAWGSYKLIEGRDRSFGVYATGMQGTTTWFADKELGHWARPVEGDIVRLR